MGFWNNWPWSNFHELNLDWILDKLKSFESQIAGMVKSWNGRTGDVTMQATDVNNLKINAVITSATDPESMAQEAIKAIYDTGARFIVYRSGDTDKVYAIVYAESSGTCTLYNLGVTSFNARKGAVSLTADDVNKLAIGIATELDATKTPADLGKDELVDLYNQGIRLILGNTNNNTNYGMDDRLWILQGDGTTIEMNLMPKYTNFMILTSSVKAFDNFTNAEGVFKAGNRILASSDYATTGKFRFIWFNNGTGEFGSSIYNPVYSFEGRKGAVTLQDSDLTDHAVTSFEGRKNAVTLEDSDLTDHAVTSFNNRKNAVTLTADDVNDLNINSVYQFDPKTDPTTFSQDDLKELWENGYRILLSPDDSGTYSGLYLLSYSGTTYTLDYYDASGKAPVQNVNGKTGSVVLSASDVGAVAKDDAYVETWNGRKGVVTLTANDVNALEIPTINTGLSTDADPTTFSQDSLAEMYDNGTRAIFVPTSTAGKYNLYFLRKKLNEDQTSYTYSATFYDPTIGSGAVTSVNGKDGVVTLDSADVGAVAKDGSNGTYLVQALNFTPDEYNPNQIAYFTKQENGHQYGTGISGVKSWNGMQGIVTYDPTTWTAGTITNSTPTGVASNGTNFYVNSALKLAFIRIDITLSAGVGSTDTQIATMTSHTSTHNHTYIESMGDNSEKLYVSIETSGAIKIRYGAAGLFRYTYMIPCK